MRRALLPALALALIGTVGSAGTGGALGAEQHQGDDVALQRVAFAGDALFAAAAPGQASRLYLVHQSGRIEILDRGRRRRTPFLDVARLISRGREQGLLGLAFHPRYRQNGRFFINYTNRGGDTRVVEYRRRNRNRANPRSARVLLRIDQPASNHNGGHLAFGPDGFLYVGTGDGGGDPRSTAQNSGSRLGKLLRIDVNGRTAGRPYRIPAGNPFRAGPAPEVYHYGLRNPWRFSFDRSRGDLWIGDVGQGAIEEVSFRAAGASGGANFGWSAFEGRRRFAGAQALRGGPHVPPVAQYSHARGCSVTGGYVSRGAGVPALRGRYVYADYCSGSVWTMRAGPNPGPPIELTRTLNVRLSGITSFGEGNGGDLYVIGNSVLYRFTRA